MTSLGKPRARLEEARRQALWRLIPAVQAFTLVDAVLLIWYFWSEIDLKVLLLWGAAITAHCLYWWFAPRKGLPSTRTLVVHAASEALLFSFLLMAVFPSVSSGRAVVLAAFATGLLAAGGLSKMSLPPAALVFTGTLGLGSMVALLGAPFPDLWVPELLMAAFTLAIGTLVLTMSQVFDARVEAEEELDRQKTLVSHLLTDFEESASESLWEADKEGRLTAVSPRVLELIGVPASELLGRSLFSRSEGHSPLDRHLPFRQEVVPLEVEGQRRWISLTGKPLKDDRGVVTGWRGVGSDITGSRLQELEMLRLSRYDSLTGLLNRHSFRAVLDSLFPEVADSHGLVLIDLVGFKDVNESLGHSFGDTLLRAVADRLRRIVPETVLVARLDGDEFALLQKGDPAKQAKEWEQLLEALKEPYLVGSDRFEAGFRLGVAYAPRDANTAEWWLRCADLALRAAKGGGRNRLLSFSHEMAESFLLQNSLREDLRGVLDRGELFVLYQPLVDLRRGQVIGVEALARWNHPTRGPIPPLGVHPPGRRNRGNPRPGPVGPGTILPGDPVLARGNLGVGERFGHTAPVSRPGPGHRHHPGQTGV